MPVSHWLECRVSVHNKIFASGLEEVVGWEEISFGQVSKDTGVTGH